MNVTSKGRYALRVMLDLAQHTADGFVSLKTVADRQGISMKYLEMIVGCLKKAELLESTRGKEGGYRLNREPADYTVGEILRQGRRRPVRSRGRLPHGSHVEGVGRYHQRLS